MLAGLLMSSAGVGAAEVPHPRPKPETPGEAAILEAAITADDDSVPIPAPRPRLPAAAGPAQRPAADAAAFLAEDSGTGVPRRRPDPSAPATPQTAALPAARVTGPDPESLRDRHRTCEEALRALGARFERGRPIREGECGAPRPLVIEAVGDVALSTPATMRCPAAVAFARWVREVVEPAASRHFATRVTGLRVAASYHCRSRRNGRASSRLSEHALANAIDIGEVRLAGGGSVAVAPRTGTSPDALFQKEIRAGGCRLFTTVLGPGSDGVHEDHLHFDLAERRSGYRLCR